MYKSEEPSEIDGKMKSRGKNSEHSWTQEVTYMQMKFFFLKKCTSSPQKQAAVHSIFHFLRHFNYPILLRANSSMNKTTLNEQAQAAYSQFMFLFTWTSSVEYCIEYV